MLYLHIVFINHLFQPTHRTEENVCFQMDHDLFSN